MEQKPHVSPAGIISLLVVIFLFVCMAFYLGTVVKTPQKSLVSQPETIPTAVPQLANPASVHCKDIGGTTEIKTDLQGNQHGICKLGNVTCDEWALFRGDCKLNSPSQQPQSTATPTTISQLANPASVNCAKLNGTITLTTRGDGGSYGVCNLGDGYACEEWALFRGDCPKSGVRTIGYDTQPQIYCALLGGKTLAVPNATCTFKDGSVCDDVALYNGQCHKGKY